MTKHVKDEMERQFKKQQKFLKHNAVDKAAKVIQCIESLAEQKQLVIETTVVKNTVINNLVDRNR